MIRSNALRILRNAAGSAVAVVLSAGPVLADEKDELAISEPAMAAQRKVLTFIGGVIVAGVVAYAVRWYQATHSGNVVNGGGTGDD